MGIVGRDAKSDAQKQNCYYRSTAGALLDYDFAAAKAYKLAKVTTGAVASMQGAAANLVMQCSALDMARKTTECSSQI